MVDKEWKIEAREKCVKNKMHGEQSLKQYSNIGKKSKEKIKNWVAVLMCLLQSLTAAGGRILYVNLRPQSHTAEIVEALGQVDFGVNFSNSL